MQRSVWYAILSAILILSACNTAPQHVGETVPHSTALRWSTNPDELSSEDLSTYADYAKRHMTFFHTNHGILWQATRSLPTLENPDKYGSGGDSLLFTGLNLSACVYRYQVTKQLDDLDLVVNAVKGLHILTNAVNIPGNLARCAAPLNAPDKWNYPASWGGRIQSGFVYESGVPAIDPVDGETLPRFVYYTRVSRDQLTGLCFGLATFLRYMPGDVGHLSSTDVSRLNKTINVVKTIAENVYTNISAAGFKIRDHTGKNETADEVDGLLKLQLLSVVRAANPSYHNDYVKEFERYFSIFGHPEVTLNQFSNLTQYYAWNLRYCRSYTIAILEEDPRRRIAISDYIRSNLFRYTKNHLNPHFIYIYNASKPQYQNYESLAKARRSIASLVIRPLRNYDSPKAKDGPQYYGSLSKVYYTILALPRLLGLSEVIEPQFREPTTYFIWQKDPWSSGYKGSPALEENCGLDYLLPYWMGRFHGFIK